VSSPRTRSSAGPPAPEFHVSDCGFVQACSIRTASHRRSVPIAAPRPAASAQSSVYHYRNPSPTRTPPALTRGATTVRTRQPFHRHLATVQLSELRGVLPGKYLAAKGPGAGRPNASW
jgi:hypothetical protein